MPKNLILNDTAFLLLCDLIHDRTGVEYGNNNRDLLAEKLSSRAMAWGFDSFLDYYYLLKYDQSAQEEWKYVMDAISVQETFFWREMDQLYALVNVLIPEYFAAHPDRALRIWSAACATGEEPLSIAIAINEAGWFERAPIEIYASDGSRSAINKAINGVYNNRALRNLPPDLKLKYFQQEGENDWRILSEIHNRIKWKVANLMVSYEINYLASASIIFCRNVFIYFSNSAIKKTIDLFYNTMPKEGYLCVAASESLLKLTNNFELQEIGGAFIYVKI